MGLSLCGVALVLRDRWVPAGILMALALTSQQFAILILVVLLVLAPKAGRLKMAAATVVTWAMIVAHVGTPPHGISGSRRVATHAYRGLRMPRVLDVAAPRARRSQSGALDSTRRHVIVNAPRL